MKTLTPDEVVARLDSYGYRITSDDRNDLLLWLHRIVTRDGATMAVVDTREMDRSDEGSVTFTGPDRAAKAAAWLAAEDPPDEAYIDSWLYRRDGIRFTDDRSLVEARPAPQPAPRWTVIRRPEEANQLLCDGTMVALIYKPADPDAIAAALNAATDPQDGQ